MQAGNHSLRPSILDQYFGVDGLEDTCKVYLHMEGRLIGHGRLVCKYRGRKEMLA